MRRSSWPVAPNDASISDRAKCRYCGAALGEEHVNDCVCRKRTVVVRMQIEYVVEVTEYWDADNIEFHRNESSWCAGNAAEELAGLFERMEERGGCPCSIVEYSYVREANEEDEERCGVRIDPAQGAED